MSKRNLKRLRKENEELKEKCAQNATPVKDPTLEALQQMEEYLKRHYDFRFNRMTETTEYRLCGTTDFMPLAQRDFNSICMSVRKSGINCWDKDVNRLIYSTQTKEYHPFVLYMQKLPLWDGTDHVADLARRVSEDDYWMRSFHRWMLAMTAQWMNLDPTHGNSVAPILISEKQGKQKSTYIKMLMPPELQSYYTDDFSLNSKGQVTRKLAEYGLVCMDEFDKETARKMPLLKNLMQTANLSFIKSYQKSFCKLPRIASFAGTSNRKELLTDPSGSRRFICRLVESKIDVTGILHQQIYAQLKAELLRGERYWFNSEEEQEIQQHNREFYKHSEEEDLIGCCFRAPQEKEACLELSAAEILLRIRKHFPRALKQATPASFAKLPAMTELEKVHRRRGNFYRVVEVV